MEKILGMYKYFTLFKDAETRLTMKGMNDTQKYACKSAKEN